MQTVKPFSGSDSKIKQIVVTFMFLMVLSYFGYHVVSGERGLLALMQLSKKVEEKRNQLDEVRADRVYLEHRVGLLRPESLDPDLLDEQARILLGYAGENERVYNY